MQLWASADLRDLHEGCVCAVKAAELIAEPAEAQQLGTEHKLSIAGCRIILQAAVTSSCCG